MGDFVKGPLDATYPPNITQGIRMHRGVDRFAHDHPVIRRSRQRLNPLLRHTRGLIIDIFYDHFLAVHWDSVHDVSLETFAARVYSLLEQQKKILPLALQRIVPAMIGHNWLVSYRDRDTMDIVLHRLSSRLSRTTGLAEAASELDLNYAGLEEDFWNFLPQVKSLVESMSCQQNRFQGLVESPQP